MRSVIAGHRLFAAALAGLAATCLSQAASAAVVFSETFPAGTASTINSATPADPTSTSAAYINIGSKAQSPASAITSGSLKFGIAATTSGHIETHARFASSPISLTTVGDSIELKVTFKPTGLLAVDNTSSQIGFGLYQSGGSNPYAGGLTGGSAPNATTSTTGISGGSQNWQGYVTRIGANTGSSRFGLRPSQSAVTTGNNQTLIGQGSASQAYAGNVTLGSNFTNTSNLTDGATYTEYLNIALTADGTYTLTSNLYTGTDSTGTNVFTQTATASTTSFLTGGFDALAIGYRQTANAASSIDINSITVTTASAVPEPVALSLIGLPALALLQRRRK